MESHLSQAKGLTLLSATPVVMAVAATLLAGLASSKMTRAQYDRALAAQQPSKAGDQWSFFLAKRLLPAQLRPLHPRAGGVPPAAALGTVWLSHATPADAFPTFPAPTTAVRPWGKVADL